MPRKLALFLMVGFLLSCASVTVVPIGEEKSYPQRTGPKEIKVFLEKPDTTFIQIAFINYEGSDVQSKSGVINGIKKKASKLGGDAIILGEIGERTAGAIVDPKSGVVTNYEFPVAKAVVIRFLP